jgi:hypothetical protein
VVKAEPELDARYLSSGSSELTDGSLSYAPLLSESIRIFAANPREWTLHTRSGSAGHWLVVSHCQAEVPAQGWKLHVSAAVSNAQETLARAIAALLSEPISFKVAASERALAFLNNGDASLSQVGKFITVYPRDDPQALRIAVALTAATRGLRGPRIPSDRRLTPEGVVYYRFGSFGGLTIQTATGEISHALRSPSGVLEPDVRDVSYRQPSWARDPFISSGVAGAAPPANPLVGNRYLIAGTLHRSVRGGVYLGVDLDQPRSCVLKHAEADALIDTCGRDARDQLRAEAAVLLRLAPDARFPRLVGLMDHDDDLYLIMDDIPGATLESHVLSYNSRGCTMHSAQVVAWGREILGMLATIHAAGFVYGDLKPTNVIVALNGQLRLVDFDSSRAHGAVRPLGQGTRGYMSPQQAAGSNADITDDIYAFGALLAYMATGAEPSHAPRPMSLLDRPLEILRPFIDPELVHLISRCLASDPKSRFKNIHELETALGAIRTRAHVIGCSEPAASPEREAAARKVCRTMSRELADTLCYAAEPLQNGRGRGWTSSHLLGRGFRGRDVNTGAAGTLLALAEAVGEFDDPFHRDVLIQGAHSLDEASGFGGDPLPGLYVGEAGVAAALLRAGQMLGAPELVVAAQTRSRRLAKMPYSSPDLFNGTAGRLRFHLILWDETQDPAELATALDAGENLIVSMSGTDDGQYYWSIPPGYGSMSNQAYLGYAHGAAGIADALLDLFEVTGDTRFYKAARGAARWIQDLAVPALDDASGLSWPPIKGAEPVAAYWCHGAAGIGRFWLHAMSLDLVPGAASLAERAIATAARGIRWAGPTQCHGLAGAIELLIDGYQIMKDPALLQQARIVEQLLLSFAYKVDGKLVWPSETPRVITPDYNVGYAGIVGALLRLADPECRPHGLSRHGFRFGNRL